MSVQIEEFYALYPASEADAKPTRVFRKLRAANEAVKREPWYWIERVVGVSVGDKVLVLGKVSDMVPLESDS